MAFPGRHLGVLLWQTLRKRASWTPRPKSDGFGPPRFERLEERRLLSVSGFQPDEVWDDAGAAQLGEVGLNVLGSETLKVYLLAGQSNMEGYAYTHQEGMNPDYDPNTNQYPNALEYLLNTPSYVDALPAETYTFKDSLAPNWLDQRDDAWAVHYDSGTGNMMRVKPTPSAQSDPWAVSVMPLGPGFGNPRDSVSMFGPELSMGQYLAEQMQSPVFLFKSNCGATWIDTDWRPPSAGGITGANYTNTVTRFGEFLDDLDADLADDGLLNAYNNAVGYEVAGFVWLQGWGNRGEGDANREMYRDMLVDLTHDIRALPRVPSGLPLIAVDHPQSHRLVNPDGTYGGADGTISQAKREAVELLNAESAHSAVYVDFYAADPLDQDFNYVVGGESGAKTFAVDLPNGQHEVTVTLGDADRIQPDQMVFLEDQLVATVTTAANAFFTETYPVTVSDGRLDLKIQSGDVAATLNAMVLVSVEGSPGPSVAAKFDFGTRDSPVADGYTRVHGGTAYDASQGYGWITAPYERYREGGKWKHHWEGLAENYLEVGWRTGEAIIASGFTGSESVEPHIAVTDSSGDPDDARIRFTTALSEFRSGAPDSFLVRPAYPDRKQYIDVTNAGAWAVTLREIRVNAPDVTVDPPLTAETDDDLLLQPGQTRQFKLTYAPTLPSLADDTCQGFDLADGLVILTAVAGAPSFHVALQGDSTFDADLTYDARADLGELGCMNLHFGETSADSSFDPTADANGDGAVDLADLGLLNAELLRQQAPVSAAQTEKTASGPGWSAPAVATVPVPPDSAGLASAADEGDADIAALRAAVASQANAAKAPALPIGRHEDTETSGTTGIPPGTEEPLADLDGSAAASTAIAPIAPQAGSDLDAAGLERSAIVDVDLDADLAADGLDPCVGGNGHDKG